MDREAHAQQGPRLDLGDAVVVGCDGDWHSDAALRFAVHEARIRGARLVVVSTYLPSIDPDNDDYDIPAAELRARAAEQAQAAMGRALGLTPRELPSYQVLTPQGVPAKVLAAEFGAAQLVVVGSQHRSALRKLTHGPDTGHLLAGRSRAPVVVVPEGLPPAPREGSATPD